MASGSCKRIQLALDEAAAAASMSYSCKEAEEAQKKRAKKDDDDADDSLPFRLEKHNPLPFRLEKLREIVRVLKAMDSSLRSKEGDISPPTTNDLRLYNLIASHVCSYIFLYHLEKDYSHEEDLPPDDDDKLPNGSDLAELVWDGALLLGKIESTLCYCRTSIIQSGDEKDPLHDHDHDHGWNDNKNRSNPQQQQLLKDILHTLEVVGEQRSYAPPREGEEVALYKDIRKCITRSLVYARAKQSLQSLSGPPVKKWTLVNSSYPESTPNVCSGLTFFPPLHQLAVSFELIPEHRDLMDECKSRLLQVFSGTQQVDSNGDATNVGQVRLMRWEPKSIEDDMQGSVVKTRLECLNTIISKLERMPPIDPFEKPSHKEVRLFVQIAQHVRSSLWLSQSFIGEFLRRNEAESCKVNVVDEDHDDNSSPILKGNNMLSRVKYLEQIVSYLRAFKSICLTEVPTVKEEEQYVKIYTLLESGLMWCFGSQIIEANGFEEKDKMTVLKKLCSTFKYASRLLEAMKTEIFSMAVMVRGAIIPGEQLSLDEAINWFGDNNDGAIADVKVFFRKLPTGSRVDNLDRAIVILHEMINLGVGIIFRLEDAIISVDGGWHEDKNYEMVAAEVENSRNIMRSEKLFLM